MIYIIRRKNNHQILFQKELPEEKKVTAKKLYPKYDSRYMEFGWTHKAYVPPFFSITKTGELQELEPPAGIMVKDGVFSLGYKTVRGKVVERTLNDLIVEGQVTLDSPFEYLEDGQVKTRTLKEVFQQDAINSVVECENYLRQLGDAIRTDIKSKYRQDDELKRTKAYLAWMLAGQPEDDPREEEYLEMERYIGEVKKKYKKQKLYATQRLMDLKVAGVSGKSTKAEMMEILEHLKIEYNKRATKKTLLDLIKNKK